jgi:hypothetical protein
MTSSVNVDVLMAQYLVGNIKEASETVTLDGLSKPDAKMRVERALLPTLVEAVHIAER